MSYGRPDASLPLAPGSIYRRFRVLPPGQRLVNLPAERLIFQPCPTATESADFPRGSGPTVSMNGDAYKLAPFHGLASVDPPDLSALDGPTMANKLAGNGPSLPLSPPGVEVSRRSITNRASTRGLLPGFRLHNEEKRSTAGSCVQAERDPLLREERFWAKTRLLLEETQRTVTTQSLLSSKHGWRMLASASHQKANRLGSSKP